jgi:hypothetical protein
MEVDEMVKMTVKPAVAQDVKYGYRERLIDIVDFCGAVESGKLGEFEGWCKEIKLFDEIDYEKLALSAGEDPIEICNFDGKMIKKCEGIGLKRAEIGGAILQAIKDKEPERLKGLRNSARVTTNDILFQFYLIKRALASANA